MENSSKVFLSAEWLDLVFLNYLVEPARLLPYVPTGTTLDSYQGKTYLSLVGFRFCKTKLWGKFSVPFHTDFEEVNLRFYVRREVGGELRRGVVFIKEIVPKPAIAMTARFIYGENYVFLPMKHEIVNGEGHREVEYSWKCKGDWMRLFARAAEAPQLPAENSLEQYITEHHWGYSRLKSGRTVQYQVTHVPWNVRHASKVGFAGDAKELYGAELSEVLRRPPDSAYIADGSLVEVFEGASLQ